MAKFNFRFNSVKKVKEALEKKAQKELAQIDLFISQHEQLKQKLIEEVNSIRMSVYDKKISASELRFLSQYKNSLHHKIDENDKEINKLKVKKSEKVEEVIQKTIEKKMMTKLEEKHIEEFNITENRNELKNFDELAVQKFARIKK
ncbi:MAG: flagellar export protein FliJ [Ignavibacteriaceae bacterium]|nr:flagellar export protein FliJ [Ignavibacteriaceae bacterium]